MPFAAELQLHEGEPSYALARHPTDPALLASAGGNDRTVILRLADTEAGLQVHILTELTGHTDTVEHVRFSTDGRLLATGALDGSIRLWNVDDWSLHKSLEGPTEVTVILMNAAFANLLCLHSGLTGIQRGPFWRPEARTAPSGCGMRKLAR